MDYKLKELRQKYERLKKAIEKPFEYNPERDWESENVQWSNYRDLLDKFAEAEKAFFEYLKEKQQAKNKLKKQLYDLGATSKRHNLNAINIEIGKLFDRTF